MKLMILGITTSIVFFYLSLRGVEFQVLLAGFRNVNYIYLLPAVILTLFGAYIRSVRWGVLLNPLEKIGQKKLFPISCVLHQL